MFGTELAHSSSGDVAYEDGKQAGLEGKTASVPLEFANTATGQRWLAGWHDGQMHIQKGIKPLNASAPTEL